MMKKIFLLVLSCLWLSLTNIFSQITTVGSGSYTTVHPGVDEAGRNDIPPGTPQLSGNAIGKPVPTNDWWSTILRENHTSNMFNYPMALKTTNNGLVVSYIPWGVFDAFNPIEVGTENLNADKVTVNDYSDWTVTLDWSSGAHNFKATAGIAMPFIYFTKTDNDIAKVTISKGNATVSGEMIIVENANYDANFVIYAPSGSTWVQSGSSYTSTLNGKNYWSMAMLPQSISNISEVAAEYKKYAYVFPENTIVDWNYNENTSVVTSTFSIKTDVKEGSDTNMLMGLLPHQWANLSAESTLAYKYSYSSVRGEIKTMEGNSFIVENTYHGILPTLPFLSNYSDGFSPFELHKKITLIEDESLATWTDSYNEGQVMNRLIQAARIADQMGNVEARDKMIATVKERLEDWLTAEENEVAFIFYYNSDWTAMLGYPAGHGQDGNLNDHHFHWGYFIHAAAFMEQFEPGWAAKWGDMINLLVRDAASPNRNDDTFPFLRNFSPYAGHCWANGFASFPQGNDQESTSESMQFNSSLIHWGSITGNDEIRDLGIYLYTTEQTAIEEYWFDMYERNFKDDQSYSLVSRVWGNAYDNQTFWTADITASYGIEMYPIHGGALYLGHNKTYVEKLWNEIKENTDILGKSTNPNLWHDVFWEYLAFIDPETAIDMYNDYPDRVIKFGVTDVQTYHWLHNMNALGSVSTDITANYPVAAAFNKNGVITYVAHNYSNSPITVKYSDGYELALPANTLATNLDVEVSGTLTSDFTQAYAKGSINFSLATQGTGITKVEYYNGNKLISTLTEAPYNYKVENLAFGYHGIYARIYKGDNFNISNIIPIQVGDQVPYLSTPLNIPGTFDAGYYDKFEGGTGQYISYFDISASNQENFRMNEFVDAQDHASEGKTVGHISSHEWLEYAVNVEESGLYSLSFRYASGSHSGGGPFALIVDGDTVASDIIVASTSVDNWDTWSSHTVNNIPLVAGENTLRIYFERGELNLGKMSFSRIGDISYSFPIANAGDAVRVLWPENSAILDGSASSETTNQDLSYSWSQIYGPTVVSFTDKTVASPGINNLAEGVYRFKLDVKNPNNVSSNDEVMVIVSSQENTAPFISLTSPSSIFSYREGHALTLNAYARDLDGSIQKVEFYSNNNLIGTVETAPYELPWTDTAGIYTITAKAIDNEGAVALSQEIEITFLEIYTCSEGSDEASEGSFEVGYKATFETVGNDVTVTFELYDDKDGLVAYLITESPFSEIGMNHVKGKIYSSVLTGQTIGEELSVACKFAFAGGLATTKYLKYTVGANCDTDTENPENFSVTIGEITQSSIELLLNATDNFGDIIYTINYNNESKTATAESGESISYMIYGLSANTNYIFKVTAADNAGNVAENSPFEISAKTLESTNTACEGTLAEAQQGSFTLGYNYKFETVNNNVNVSFELLDNKSGVIAFLWNTTSGFEETALTESNGVFSTTLSGQSEGTVLKLACKFAYEGGLSATKELSYTVGNNCGKPNSIKPDLVTVRPYPNPIENKLFIPIQGLADIKTQVVVSVFNSSGMSCNISAELTNDIIVIDFSCLPKGLYFVQLKTTDEVKVWKSIKK